MSVIVCGPPPGVYKRAVKYCPECDRRHRFIVRWDGAWYGTTLYGSCGDRWSDGYRAPRPFTRNWRREEQDHFRRMWDNATTAAAYERYIAADCGLYSPHIKKKRQETKALRRAAVALELVRRERAS